MKKGTSRHPKMLKLARLLGISRHAAVGLMNDLWEWAGQYTPRGDIGAHSNEDIIDGIGVADVGKTAADIVQALVDARWIDLCSEHRLVIHDWADHCESWIKKRVERSGEGFVTVVPFDNNNLFYETADNGGQRQTKSDNVRPHAGGARLGKAKALAGGSAEGGDFDAWWARYPHKVGKKAAKQAYATARKSVPADVLLRGLDAYVRDKPPDRNWCNPATWLNQGRWEDQPAAGGNAKPPDGLEALTLDQRDALYAFTCEKIPDVAGLARGQTEVAAAMHRQLPAWREAAGCA